ncbi:phosphatase PAP2 family protein [Streptomyces sp. B-S-A8]|uniref:Phosphatase PAP2 family protein n=1 Tax=Streptomyces solicavernae TaxID=3043614 RepID=A0ABT6RV90_9ACTN|nr:phosphatase PAP2 family protein [Streptomyces sp. B-S-A8]MDI3388355.1 phosphatase PAP2 family protein [Streptomyces sp. B-S-A8]
MRHAGPHGRPGTTPPVPGRPAPFRQLLAASAALGLGFALVSWQVAASGPFRAADERFAGLVRRSGLPDGVAELLADLGHMTVAPVVLAAAVAYAVPRARRAAEPRWWLGPLCAALALAAVPLLVAPLKALFDRPGPPGTGGADGSGGFYPSGHAATAIVAYGAAALLVRPWLRTARLRRGLLAGTALLVAAVGYGLVRRGYHWPLDVLASWLLGGMLLTALTLTARRSTLTARRST